MKILLGYFNEKLRREDTFRLTFENMSFHATNNDNGVAVVNLAISNSLSRLPCS
jgi:hypothetical protein